MLQSIEPWVASADFSICHLESVLSSTNTDLSFYPRYIAPNQIADALQAAGWDACSVASNHALDGGFDGVAATLDELDARGIGHSGTARSPDERLPSLYEVNGVTLAHLSFSQHFNGLSTPETRPWAANKIDVETILSDAKWARRRGAEFVVVSLHWGIEYASNPIGYQNSVAQAVLEDPAVDLILGHHAHVVEPIGMVEGKYVVFSMGNHHQRGATGVHPRRRWSGRSGCDQHRRRPDLGTSRRPPSVRSSGCPQVRDRAGMGAHAVDRADDGANPAPRCCQRPTSARPVAIGLVRRHPGNHSRHRIGRRADRIG